MDATTLVDAANVAMTLPLPWCLRPPSWSGLEYCLPLRLSDQDGVNQECLAAVAGSHLDCLTRHHFNSCTAMQR